MNNNLVKAGYNKAARTYLSKRDIFKNNKYLDLFIEKLPTGASILDIGCGAGVPIDKYLSDKGLKVLGIDISENQIKLARKNVPEAKFNVVDMEELKRNEYSVDAIVSFYAIFHINREKHQALFKTIQSYLKPKGLLLVTMG